MENLFKQLSAKNIGIVRQIAMVMISLPINEKIPTTKELSSKYQVGYGTIQKILNTFEKASAIQLQTRGYKGTFIMGKDIPLLWNIAGGRTVIGAMPLPDNKDFRLTASGIRYKFEQAKIPFNFIYLDGAKRRFELLMSKKCDFAIMSGFAAGEMAVDNIEDIKITVISEGTFHKVDTIVILTNSETDNISEIKKVGIDSSSPDHKYLTENEFKKEDVGYIEGTYSAFPDMILSGIIDAAIWHTSTLSFPIGYNELKLISLVNSGKKVIPKNLSQTVIITKTSNSGVGYLLDNEVSSLNLKKIEKEIEKNNINLVL